MALADGVSDGHRARLAVASGAADAHDARLARCFLWHGAGAAHAHDAGSFTLGGASDAHDAWIVMDGGVLDAPCCCDLCHGPRYPMMTVTMKLGSLLSEHRCISLRSSSNPCRFQLDSSTQIFNTMSRARQAFQILQAKSPKSEQGCLEAV